MVYFSFRYQISECCVSNNGEITVDGQSIDTRFYIHFVHRLLTASAFLRMKSLSTDLIMKRVKKINLPM